MHVISALDQIEISDEELLHFRNFFENRVPDLPIFLKRLLESRQIRSRLIRPSFKDDQNFESFNLPRFSTSYKFRPRNGMTFSTQLSLATDQNGGADPTGLEVNLWYAAMSSETTGLMLSPHEMPQSKGFNSGLVSVLTTMLYEAYRWIKESPEDQPIKTIWLRVLSIQNLQVEEILRARGFQLSHENARPTYEMRLQLR